VDAGYSSQIVLGTDIYLKIFTRRRGGEGCTRLIGFVVPTLHRLGVAPVHITAMSVDNPARILSRASEGELLKNLEAAGMKVITPDAAAIREKAKSTVNELFKTAWPVTTWDEVLAQ
jgi:hypothetical protein